MPALDGEDVRGRVVLEDRLRAIAATVNEMFGAVLDAARAVVLVPALVQGDLDLVVARGQGAGAQRVEAVAVRVLEPGAQAARVPVARAAELALEAAGGDRDHLVAVVRDPVGLVRVVELHAGRRRGRGGCCRRCARRPRRSSRPTSDSGRPCTPSCRREPSNVPCHTPSSASKASAVASQLGLPVAGAAELRLQAARDDDVRWGRRVRGAHAAASVISENAGRERRRKAATRAWGLPTVTV